MSQQPFPDETNTIDEVEEGEDQDVQIRVRPPKPRKNGATNPRQPSDAQMSSWGAAIAASGRELNAERVRGPNGKNDYARRPVQLGMLPQKLPPEATGNLVAALSEAAGGGWYKVWPDNAKPGEVLWPIKVAGRPKPLDAAQAADEEAEAQEREALGEQPLPHLGGGLGHLGGGLSPLPPLDATGAPPSYPGLPPGWVFDPMTRRPMPATPYGIPPYNDGALEKLKEERDQLRKQVEIEPLKAQLAELKTNGGGKGSTDIFGGMLSILQAQQAEAAKARDHELTMAREAAKLREAAEEKRLEREREERKAQKEAEERKWERDREREKDELARQREREREDRIERDKDRKAMLDMVLKSMRPSNGTDDILKLVQAAQGVKDLNAPPPKSEVAEVTEAVGAVGKDLIGAIGDAVNKNRPPGANPPSGGSSTTPAPANTDEKAQALDVIAYIANMAKNRDKISPDDAYIALLAFCAGRNYDVNKVLAKMKEYGDAAKVAELLKTLRESSESTLLPAEVKTKCGEAAKVLEVPDAQAWLLELGGMA